MAHGFPVAPEDSIVMNIEEKKFLRIARSEEELETLCPEH